MVVGRKWVHPFFASPASFRRPFFGCDGPSALLFDQSDSPSMAIGQHERVRSEPVCHVPQAQTPRRAPPAGEELYLPGLGCRV